ncbi:hypothetical protein O181_055188 [Austropuccinia psidii MF-1]|uniref:Uncharacterized protein n=1 Tax=Austropuccinia psidii MF-1 TaxID=1389203 RepID=A0A9Q3EAN7_9BASI|nr:hypothetical protein [Austropuccinia psidii MF-1]
MSSSSFSSTVFSGSTRRTHFKHRQTPQADVGQAMSATSQHSQTPPRLPQELDKNLLDMFQKNDPYSNTPHVASSQYNESLSPPKDKISFELSTHDSLVKKASLIVNLHTKPTFPEAPSTQEPIKSPPSNAGKSQRKPHPHDLVSEVLILPYQESPTSDTSYSSMEAQLGTSLSEETEIFKTYSGPVSQGKDSQQNLQEVVNTSGEFLEISTQIADECDSHLDSSSLHAVTNTSVLPESDDNHSTFASIATLCIKDDLPAKQEPVQVPSKSRSIHVEQPNSYLEHKLVNCPQSPLLKGLHEAQDLFKKEPTAAHSTIVAKPAQSPYCTPQILAQGSKPHLQEVSSSHDSLAA